MEATGFLTAEQVRRLSALAVAGGAGAGAEKSEGAPFSAERDRARAEALVGSTCYFTAFGNSFDMSFFARGRALITYTQGDVDLDWKLENDRLCLSGDIARGVACVELPASGGTDRAMLETKIRDLCLKFQMRRPPGPLG